MTKQIINLKNIDKEYKLGQTKITALKDVSLDIQAGEFISVCGPSGSGKTTLLNIIGCLDTPTKGNVKIIEKDVINYSDAKLSELRNKYIGFIFQSFNLIPVLSTFENVDYPLVLLGMKKKQRQEKVHAILSEVGLYDHKKHRPDELSGGQRQRVAIARALVTNPKLVLADEPTANLDHKTGVAILDLMQKMNEEHNCTFIFSTHDPEVMKYAKKIYHLRDGEIQKQGKRS
ncbi:MAG: ABC transporter ATP-binding protein [bacterium]|nr:ABC transporter ATP-binding protein [bacterium]